MSQTMFECTVVSVVPFRINEFKPGLIPGHFVIEPAKEGDFEILIVGPSRCPVYIDSDRGSFNMSTPSNEIARSICEDYCSAQLAIVNDSEAPAKPGLFWVMGTYTKPQVASTFKKELETARENQRRWFRRLVEIADDDWAKYHQHKAISDLQRFAAKSLKLERDWLIEINDSVIISSCPACQSAVSPHAAICPHCHCILNKDMYDKLAFAGGKPNVILSR